MKKLRVMILSIVMLMTITSISNATQFSCKVGITASKNEVKVGDTVTLNFSINDLQLSDGAPGVTILDGFLEYDTEIFEDIKQSDINCGTNRSVTYLDTNKRIYVEFENKDGMITNSGTIMFSITMKIKENAKFEKTQVKLNNIIITDNNEEIKINSVGVLLQEEVVTPTNKVPSENITKPSDRSKRKTNTTENVITSDIKREIIETKTTNTIQEPNKSVVDILNIGWLFNNDGSIKIENIITKSVTVINEVSEVLISICM